MSALSTAPAPALASDPSSDFLHVERHPLDAFFRPRSVAVVGATEKRGQRRPDGALEPHQQPVRRHGLPGQPQARQHSRRQGLSRARGHRRPGDLAVICTPATVGAGLMDSAAKRACTGDRDHRAGFREIGAEGAELEQPGRLEAAEFDGMRILGPNCLGIMCPVIDLNASFAAAIAAEGSHRLHLAVRRPVHLGARLGAGRRHRLLVLRFGRQHARREHGRPDRLFRATTAHRARSFSTSSRSARRGSSCRRPGRSPAPSRSWPTRRAGSPSRRRPRPRTPAPWPASTPCYEAAFQRAGIERIFQIEDMFDCAEMLARQQPPKGDRLAIITNAGGPGVMTTDALIDRDGKLADSPRRRWPKLNEFLPPCWSHGNPIDVLGDAPPDRFAKAVEIVLKDKNVDAVLVILTPQAMTDPTATAEAVGRWRRRPQAGAGGLDGRPRARGHPDAQQGRHPHLQHAGEGGARVHAPGVLRPQSGDPPRNARDIPLAFSLDPPTAATTCSTRSSRGGRDPLGERVARRFSRPTKFRSPSRRPPARPTRRSKVARRDRLSGGDEDPLAADHPQDRRRRRGAQPRTTDAVREAFDRDRAVRSRRKTARALLRA